MRTPMPSPRGTNFAGLYVTKPGTGAAYDADPDAGKQGESKAIAWLKEKLSENDFAEFISLFGGESDPEGAADEPNDFPGKPKPGGTIAGMDQQTLLKVGRDASGGISYGAVYEYMQSRVR